MDDLERYLDQIVEPTIKDFEERPTSVRHAFLACVAVFHSLDYLAFDSVNQRPRKGRVGNLRKSFGGLYPEFRLVDQIAHAFKHVVSDRGDEGVEIGASEIISRVPAGYGDGGSGSGAYGGPGGATLESETTVDLLRDLKRSVDILRRSNTRRSGQPAARSLLAQHRE
jgi:hypothetical protein